MISNARKSVGRSSIVSPLSNQRPLKRNRVQRDEPFSFNLNFVAGEQVEVDLEVSNGRETEKGNRDGNVDRIDLNNRAASDLACSSRVNESPEVVFSNVEAGTVPKVAQDDCLVKEVENTIAVGLDIGVDLNGHIGLVKKVVAGKGNNVVLQ
ncbi:hypothetical protein Hanom_Chr01g00055401 [Helianthus anomalus]